MCSSRVKSNPEGIGSFAGLVASNELVLTKEKARDSGATNSKANSTAPQLLRAAALRSGIAASKGESRCSAIHGRAVYSWSSLWTRGPCFVVAADLELG